MAVRRNGLDHWRIYASPSLTELTVVSKILIEYTIESLKLFTSANVDT